MKVCFREDNLIKMEDLCETFWDRTKRVKRFRYETAGDSLKGNSTYTESMFTAPNSNRFLSTSLGDMLVGS